VHEHAPAALAGERSEQADELERSVAQMYERTETSPLELDAYLRD
jgi:hypothetical protein